ncbi:hypothetical protein JXA80_12315 [bacterium]|nr:hypothetical protein [candidate division CSSED10-310 bacterium]
MKKLGEILLDQGLITPDQLEHVLRRQSMSGGRFGEHLVQLLLLDETQVHEMLALQKGVPAVKPTDLEDIPEDVIHALPGEIVSTYRVVPFRLLGRRLHVAMINPDDIQMVDEVSHRSGFIIRPYVCMESVLNRALARYYHIAPSTSADASVEASLMQDLIVHDNQYTADKAAFDTSPSLVSIDNTGQFSMIDRAQIICDKTKSLFLESGSTREALGYFLQFMEQIGDSLVFMAVDGSKNSFWRNVADFRAGTKGTPLYDKLYKSAFWNRYLQEPELKYFALTDEISELKWVPRMLQLDDARAFVIVPVRISNRLLGIAISGSASSVQLREELETIQKLLLITEYTLTILRCRRSIQEVE